MGSESEPKINRICLFVLIRAIERGKIINNKKGQDTITENKKPQTTGANMAESRSKSKKVVSLSMETAASDVLDAYVKETGRKKNEVVSEALYEKLLSGARQEAEEYDKPMIIDVVAYKGGSGKTTTAVNLAVCLGERGKSVLLIDLDGQGNASQYLQKYDPNARKPCIANVLLNNKSPRLSLEEVIESTEYENVDVAPSHFGFAAADGQMRAEATVVGIENRLKQAIESLDKHYDYIILDCAPNLDLVTTNSIVALQAGNPNSCYIIPVKADGFSPAGLQDTVSAVVNTEAAIRGATHQINVIRTVVEARTTVYRFTTNLVRTEFRDVNILETVIPKNVAVVESTVASCPVIKYAKEQSQSEQKRSKPVVDAFHMLTDEVLSINVLPPGLIERLEESKRFEGSTVGEE